MNKRAEAFKLLPCRFNPRAVGQEVTWSVAVQRATATACTYWITVTNLTAAPITFEARYAIVA